MQIGACACQPRSCRKIRRLVDSNIIGIFIWDFDGRIVEANDEFLRMVSYDREDLVFQAA
jgi:PAS domain-containing protein